MTQDAALKTQDARRKTAPVRGKPTIVAPSVLACDFLRVGEDCTRIERAGADWLHLDVMDGHFVDNLSFGPAVVEAIAGVATVPLDVHLMIERPDHFYRRFTPYVANVTIHVEPPYDVAGTLKAIRQEGRTAGLAISPPSDFRQVEPYLDRIDLLLVMTVNPGFGGQAFLPETMAKVERAAQIRAERNLNFHIQVDGGINHETAAVARRHGANVMVAGTTIFRAPDPAQAIRSLRS
ncbi:MAG: ribulose-phosphate 3-epimerase [Verrucomicrobia bacterium]|nr:ribulose-phosphate 3-epimerase [Verrucomicrobiota bacterium]